MLILEITCRWLGFVLQQEVLKTFPGLSRICERNRLADCNFNIHYDLFPSYDVCGQLSLVMVRLLLCLRGWPFTSRRWTHVFLGLLVNIALLSVESVQYVSWKSPVGDLWFVLQQDVLKTFPGLSWIRERNRLAHCNFNIHYDLFPSYDVCGQRSLVMVRLLLCLRGWPFTSRRWTHVFLGLLVNIALLSIESVQCESWKSPVVDLGLLYSKRS